MFHKQLFDASPCVHQARMPRQLFNAFEAKKCANSEMCMYTMQCCAMLGYILPFLIGICSFVVDLFILPQKMDLYFLFWVNKAFLQYIFIIGLYSKNDH